MVISSAGHRIDSNFTEDTVGFAIESYLTMINFPRLRFSIVPFSRYRERYLDADARLVSKQIEGFRPFYLQFKRPSAYPDYSRSRIIKDRKSLSLIVHPRALYFRLRTKTSNQSKLQHNVLYRLQDRLKARGLGAATYVCPLFLDRDTYRYHVHFSALLRWLQFWKVAPFDLETVTIRHGRREIPFDNIPILKEHVSIPPHDIVASAKHNYSFDESGEDVCFHSPTILPNENGSLALFLKDLSRNFLLGEGQIKEDTANEVLRDLVASLDDSDVSMLHGWTQDDPIGNWFSWGQWLRMKYDVEQFALVIWKEEDR